MMFHSRRNAVWAWLSAPSPLSIHGNTSFLSSVHPLEGDVERAALALCSGYMYYMYVLHVR
jgi:hypothetical protein